MHTKNISIASAVVLLAAVGAAANSGTVYGDYSTYTMMDLVSAVELDGQVGPRAGEVGTLFSNMNTGPNGFVSFPTATGPLGLEDYDTGFSGLQTLDTYRFVGGVDGVGQVLFFEFFDSASNFVDGFSLAFGGGGIFIYTITGGGGGPIGTAFDSVGFHQIVADVGTTGQWFLGDGGPTVGSSDPTVGGSNPFQHLFELNAIPAPGALALFGLGGLMAPRRRR